MEQIYMGNTKESCTAWYGWLKDEKVRMESSSGGVFTAMANIVLDRGGVVVAAYFDPQDKRVKHGSSDLVSLERMRRSKYVESDVTQAYPLIEEALKADRSILFCGTPCQCAGIRKVFGHNEKLLLCDFFCHGVPSGLVFRDFLQMKEKKKGKKITDYQFRTKDFGWSQYGIRTSYENGSAEKTVGRCEFFFTAAMIGNQFLRRSCYTCDKSMYHASDFTIGDFWGIANMEGAKRDERGISLLLANTDAGKAMFPALGADMELYPLQKHYLDYAFKVKTADKKLPERNAVFERYRELGIRKFSKKFYGKKLRLRRIVFSLRKRKLRMGE